ncbi:hypothetical protein O3G_MSEX013172 [Manduca sexta]|uniref:Glycoside hydrolase family 38 central domain-containing protein n=1 Tax=Manduca sexta TaxID=7130 RepID=A0A921ZQV5_MANSE|nr:hypothetical protein O3G_MSEX013172 [Manduca sexta]
MVMMGKRMGYYDASVWFANIDKLINEVNQKSYSTGANLHLFYSTPACYLKAVHRENPQLETKQDDFLPLAYDKFSHATGMYTSRPTLKYVAREGHLYLLVAKQLQLFARLWSNNKIFEDLNWIVGVFQDHNIISGALREYVKDYYMEKMERAVQKATLLFKQAFNKLRKSSLYTLYHRCSFNISSCNNTESRQSFIVIYNPLAWNVTIPVRLPIQNVKYDVWDPNLKEITTSTIRIPQPVLDIPERRAVAEHELVFLADLPPLGFKSYFLRKQGRQQRSIIKKIKNTNKKYLIRQTSNLDIDDDSLLNVKDDYFYAEDVTEKPGAKIEFANVTKTGGRNFGVILTPKPRVESTTVRNITKDEVFYHYDEVTERIEETTVIVTEAVTTTKPKIMRKLKIPRRILKIRSFLISTSA